MKRKELIILTIEIANKLIELRRNKGLSQEELADRLGISRQAVSKWERAESSPDIDNIIMLSRLYGISVDELLCNEDSPGMDEAELGETGSAHSAPVGTADGIRNLKISVRGSVELLGSDGSGCEIALTGPDDEKDSVRMSRDGDTFNIVQDDDDDEGFFGRMFRSNKSSLVVTVTLPRRMGEISAILKSGSLISNGLSADILEAKLGGGRASVEDGRIENLSVKTGGGSIIVKDVNGGTAGLKTGGGTVKAEGVSFSGKVSALTDGGSVLLSGTMREAEAASGGGDVRLFVRDADSVEAKTGGGGVAVELSETDGAEAELRSGGSRARIIAFGNEIMSGGSVRASVGTGRTKVRAVSGGGSVNLIIK